jgi:hypothetical protein
MSKKTPEPPDDGPNPERPSEEPKPPFRPMELDTPEVDWFQKGTEEGKKEKRHDH